MEDSNWRPGLYRHYKGGYYLAFCVARLSEHRSEEVVVYYSLNASQVWVRPYSRPMLEGDDCWLDDVVWPDGVTRNRFVHIDDL